MRRAAALVLTIVILILATYGAYAAESPADPSDLNNPTSQGEPSNPDNPGEPETSDETGNSENPDETVDPTSREYILGLVKAVEVDATLKKTSKMYSDAGLKKPLKTLAKGTKVKLLRDKNTWVAYIKLDEKTRGWISYSCLDISKQNYTRKEAMTGQQRELFVNYSEYASDTASLVWVNIERQQLSVFQGSKGKWKLRKALVCSSGSNTTPSINGRYKYYNLHKKRALKDYYVVNFMRYYDTFAIHSIPFNYDHSINDGRLGVPVSHGCIRVSVADSQWLVKNIPMGTSIIVN